MSSKKELNDLDYAFKKAQLDLMLIEIEERKFRLAQERKKASEKEHLKWMLLAILSNDSTPQMNRWLGFVQGVLVCKDYITVSELREMSRGMDE